MTALTDAVRIARTHNPIHKSVTRPEFWCRSVIVRKDCGRLAVYRESAWTRPTQETMLPWGAPTGVKIATVDLNGRVRKAT